MGLTEKWTPKNLPPVVVKPKPKRKPPAKQEKVNDGN